MDRGDFGGGGGTAVDGHDGMTVRPRAAPRARACLRLIFGLPEEGHIEFFCTKQRTLPMNDPSGLVHGHDVMKSQTRSDLGAESAGTPLYHLLDKWPTLT